MRLSSNRLLKLSLRQKLILIFGVVLPLIILILGAVTHHWLYQYTMELVIDIKLKTDISVAGEVEALKTRAEDLSNQVLLNTIDFGMNPQEALDAPRFQWVGGKKVQLERAVPTDIALKLAAMGHEVEIMNDTYSMGRGEIIWRWDDEVLVGASEPRCDGHVASW